MPLFDEHMVRHLVGEDSNGDLTLDLRGATEQEACLAIDGLLGSSGHGPSLSAVILLDPATPTSGETLFLPVGRQLLLARKSGRIMRFSPLPGANGGGFHVELSGRAGSPGPAA